MVRYRCPFCGKPLEKMRRKRGFYRCNHCGIQWFKEAIKGKKVLS